MIQVWIDEYFQISDGNVMSKEAALDPRLAGLKLFDRPIIGVASAMDPIFERYAVEEEIDAGRFIPPHDWLPTARSVVSLFLPYTDQVKRGNGQNLKAVSQEWLHGRYEGQQFILGLTAFLTAKLEEQGFRSLGPCLDKRMVSHQVGAGQDGTNQDFWSTWSERHVAYAAGLGTFGLSKNLITRRGTAGRFTSLITELDLPVTERAYIEVYEYCNRCGRCVSNCPVGAIDKKTGKDHVICSAYLDQVYEVYKPRYACGKCQVLVPCQNGIPKQRRKG
jgi:epoxyqueuosine reductase QueG